MMMKVSEVVFVLSSCVLCLSADVLYEDIKMVGCSDTDGQMMYSLDGDVKWYADFINKRGVEPQPAFIDHITYPEETYEQAVADQQVCRENLKTLKQVSRDMLPNLDLPSHPIMYTRDEVELGQNNTLICHVTGFYPAPVKIYWTKKREKMTEGASVTVPHPNKDGSFSQISRLQFVPRQGDIYSCNQPLTRVWNVHFSPDVGVQQPCIGPEVFWGLCLAVRLLGAVAATFFLIKWLQRSSDNC